MLNVNNQQDMFSIEWLVLNKALIRPKLRGS